MPRQQQMELRGPVDEPGLVVSRVRQLRRSDVVAEACLRECEVDLREALDIPDDRLCLPAHLGAQRAQDALDLAFLLELRLAPLVAELNDDERLQPDRRTATGHVVDDAFELAAHVGLDRDDVASVTKRNDRFLRDALRDVRRQDLLHALIEPVVQRADLATERPKRRARLIRHLAALIDASVDRVGRVDKRLDAVDDRRQDRQRLVEPADR